MRKLFDNLISYTPGTLAKYKTVYRVIKKYVVVKNKADDIRLDEMDYRQD